MQKPLLRRDTFCTRVLHRAPTRGATSLSCPKAGPTEVGHHITRFAPAIPACSNGGPHVPALVGHRDEELPGLHIHCKSKQGACQPPNQSGTCARMYNCTSPSRTTVVSSARP
jgi:hypothetical protein